MSSMNINPAGVPPQPGVCDTQEQMANVTEPKYDAAKQGGSPRQDGIEVKDGKFWMRDENGKPYSVDLNVVLMMTSLKRTMIFDDQLNVFLAEIRDRNHVITKLIEYTNKLRMLLAERTSPSLCYVAAPDGKIDNLHNILTSIGVPMNELEHPYPGYDPMRAAIWESMAYNNIDMTKSRVEVLTNHSNMANTRVQSVLEKRCNAFEMVGKIMEINGRTVISTLRGLRGK